MLEPRTHYEQVPLEIVRKIVQKQNLQETTTEQTQGTKNMKPKTDHLEAQEELMERSRLFSEQEL